MPPGDRLVSTVLAIALTLELAMLGIALAPGAQAQTPEPYHSYEQMKTDTQALAEEYDVAEYEVVGSTTLGQEIFAVDVANGIDNRSDEELAQLPTLYVDGAHHGNEILSAEAAYYFLTRVLENAAEDPSYLEGKRLVVNPIVNPDGYTRDQRENVNGVDLNRNYPFHWGLYGTSEIPFTGNYRGEEAASETETQTNIELMRSLNLYAHVTGHTGTYDLVLPWRQSEDGEIPDWPLYEKTLAAYENESGLEYRDPSGAGEAHAWSYGKRAAFGILPEVSEEQTAPASTEQVEQRLDEVLQVYRVTWENLTHLGGELHVEDVNGTNVTLHNDGWGPAYNLTPLPRQASNVETNATNDTTALPDVASGETVTLELPAGTTGLRYERVTIPGEEPDQRLKTTSFAQPLNATEEPVEDDDGLLAIPTPGLLALLVAALTAALRARRPRG